MTGFTRNTVKDARRICRCGADFVRPNQGNCRACNAIAQKQYRKRNKERHEAEHRAFLKSIARRIQPSSGADK